MTQAGDFRHVAVRNGAIAGRKNQHHDSDARTRKLADRLAMKVKTIGLSCMNAGASQDKRGNSRDGAMGQGEHQKGKTPWLPPILSKRMTGDAGAGFSGLLVSE